MLRLTVINGPFPGQSESYQGSEISIGRGADNDCVIRDPAVSKHHGKILRLEHGYVYRDLGSRHGSTLAYLDQVVRLSGSDAGETSFLSHGSRLQIGKTIILVGLDFRDVPLLRNRPRASGKLNLRQLVSGPRASGFVRSLLGEDEGGFGETNEEAWREETAFEETGDLAAVNFDRSLLAELSEDAQVDRQSAFYKKAETLIDAVTPNPISRQYDDSDSRLRRIIELIQNTAGSGNDTQNLQQIVQTTCSLYPLAHCLAIHLFNAEGELAAFMTRFSGGEQAEDTTSVICRPLLEQAVQTGQTILYIRGGDHGPLPAPFVEGAVWSGLYAPLHGRDRILGVFSMTSQSSRQMFLPEELKLFEQLTAAVALIMERAIQAKALSSMFSAFVRASVFTIETRDPPSAGHAERVSSYCLALAAAVDEASHGTFAAFHFTSPELRALRLAALLHDFGKVTVSDSLLRKRARLSEKEMRCIEERFGRIKELHRRVLLEELCLEFHRAGRCPSPLEMQELETDCVYLRSRLDSICHFVESVRHRHTIDSGTWEKIESLRGAHVQFGNDRISLLEPEELEHLAAQRDSNLTPNELSEVRSHLARTVDFLNLIPWTGSLRLIPKIVERYYKRQEGEDRPAEDLGQDKIQLLAEIVALTHVFDAWTARDRPYRQAISIPKALRELSVEAEAGRLSAPLVELFVDQIVPQLTRSRLWHSKTSAHLPDLGEG